MSAPGTCATEILTEHLGYPPIAVIDDIINAVNGVMYKCTQAVETYLIQKQKHGTMDKDPDTVVANSSTVKPEENEVEVGTAKLETLLENSVDKNFDKFELYALRNILTIPNDLSDEGWIRLKHYEGVDLNKKADVKSVELDLKINALYKEITVQLFVKKQLLIQMKRAKKIVKLLTLYKNSVSFLSERPEGSTLPAETVKLLESLAPLDQTFYYLVSQTTELFHSVEALQSVFSKPVEEGGILGLDTDNNERDKYLSVEATKLLRILGLADNKSKMERLLGNLHNVDFENAEVKEQLKTRFGI